MWEIDSKGVARVGRRISVFPDFFAGYKLYPVTEEKLAFLDPEEVIGFYIYLTGLPEDGVISVFGEGLLTRLDRGEDRLRLAKNFRESHSVEEVKEILAARVPKEIEASEHDWERITKVANKFGIERVVTYFLKLWQAYEETSDDILWRGAVPFLLDIVPTPEYALKMVEEA
jgi:hypothetical protein